MLRFSLQSLSSPTNSPRTFSTAAAAASATVNCCCSCYRYGLTTHVLYTLKIGQVSLELALTGPGCLQLSPTVSALRSLVEGIQKKGRLAGPSGHLRLHPQLKSGTNHPHLCMYGVFFVCFLIPFTYYLRPSFSCSLAVTQNPWSHNRTPPPLPPPLRNAFCIFIARRVQQVLPSSTRAQLCIPTL